MVNNMSFDPSLCEEPPFSIAEIHQFHGEPLCSLLGTSEPLGWRNLLVLDWQVDTYEAAGDILPVDDHMIVLQLTGTTKLNYQLGNVRGSKVIFPGQISIVPGGYHIDGSSDAKSSLISVYLRASMVAQILAQNCTGDRAILLPHVAVMDPVLSGLIHGVAGARSWQYIASQAYIDQFALALAAHLSENYSTRSKMASRDSDKPLPSRTLKIVDEYIRAHIAHDIGVTDIARAAGYNPAYFSRIFKRTLGVPPYQYLLNRRVHAVRDSLHTAARLADIAAATGFCNQEHMTRAFRQFHGISPSHYRRELRSAV